MSRRWSSFYASRLGPGYLEYAKARYGPFIREVCDAMVGGDVVTELGAGIGTITAILDAADLNVNLHATDVDPWMLARLRDRFYTKPYGRPRIGVHRLNCLVGDTIAGTTLVHSHGLLEHFSDDQVLDILGANRSARQVHYVPGMYPTKSFGDERLLPIGHWVELTRPAKAFHFNDGLDYCLVYEPR